MVEKAVRFEGSDTGKAAASGDGGNGGGGGWKGC